MIREHLIRLAHRTLITILTSELIDGRTFIRTAYEEADQFVQVSCLILNDAELIMQWPDWKLEMLQDLPAVK